MLSGQWARILSKSYCRLGGRDVVAPVLARELLERSRRAWNGWLANFYLPDRVRRNRPIQWYEEPGLEAGAFATLVGLTLEGHGRLGLWQAVAAGDSCLFQVRYDSLVACFPISDSAAFGNRPLLLSSNPRWDGSALKGVRTARGGWMAGDRFYLMTDALAAWFLSCWEREEVPRWLMGVAADRYHQKAFANGISKLRSSGAMRNDDVTMLSVELCPEASTSR
jgi:hypothetical protein